MWRLSRRCSKKASSSFRVPSVIVVRVRAVPSRAVPSTGPCATAATTTTHIYALAGHANGRETVVHLVYIHGFQGNDTSFQTFPTDLHEYLAAKIPAHLKLQSSLYPTYKSRKPIAQATQNFLSWLSTQPPGPVILLAHSMGGLLAADAATDASNLGNPRSRRILGVIAFDVPYLGLHPHVVVSGIASLFPADDDENKTTEAEMNKHSDVQIVDERVTDDWDAFKRDIDAEHASRSSLPRTSSSFSSPPPSTSTPFLDKTLSFLSAHADDPLVRWVRKHSDEPFSAGMRLIVEYFQFGSSMFDPSGLKDRYTRLVAWPGGVWVNYWTHTPQRGEAGPADSGILRVDSASTSQSDVSSFASLSPTPSSLLSTSSNSLSSNSLSSNSLSTNSLSTNSLSSTSLSPKELKKLEKQAAKEEKKAQRAHEKELKKHKHGAHHFVVLPTSLGLGGSDKWEPVVISVDDEVKAHTGIFMRDLNRGYEELVERVAGRVMGWCEVLGV
ncbi:hypothetical protein FB45DRAFT_83027 [Roridomyces roridus]|uniref:AB hydrolase-1 domain-containing protein n=1 Tax=Roridomyces roridus TaxID=1738132 RepID=A0AAD7FJW3_9AGAR|nr:hypothetical protein FB45DRAFT_83027 [Roridomyces roridus]